MKASCLLLSRVAKRRSQIYGVLAAVYSGPIDEAFLKKIHRLSIPVDKFLPVKHKQLASGLRQISLWLEKHSILPEGTVSSQLSPEFTRLFRGVNRNHSPLPPYESVYLEGRLFGKSTDSIKALFREYSLEPLNNEPPDHISLELDFMRSLCSSEAESWRSCSGVPEQLRQEKSFLDEHMLRWVPYLCKQIRKFDNSGFYKSLADVTEGWIYYDQTVVDGLAKKISPSTITKQHGKRG